MEAKHDDVHVEGVKIDDSLVDVFLVDALATILEDKLDQTVNCTKNFGSKGVIRGNSILVNDSVLSFGDAHEFLELHCEIAFLSKKKLVA